MKRLPFLLAGVFIAITLTRVASLAANTLGAGWLGWAFAVGLGVGVLVFAYWLKSNGVGIRPAALTSLVIFVVADGLFNGAEVYRHMVAAGTWSDPLLRLAGIVYALFPTVAVGLLGWMIGRIDRLPPTPMRKTAILPRIRLWLAAQVDAALPLGDVGATQEIAAASQTPISLAQPAQPAKQYVCVCGRVEHTSQAFAGHAKGCVAYRAQAAHKEGVEQ